MNTDNLSKRVDSNLAQLELDRQNTKQSQALQKEINEAPLVALNDFWCDKCKIDFVNKGIKIVINSFKEPIAKYDTKCACGKICRRYITDKLLDPYWNQSKKVKRERIRERVALLQPHEYGFKTHYGDINKSKNKDREDSERDEHEATHQIHKYFKD